VGQQHALIIDDNLDNLGILAQMLSLEGIDYTQIINPTQVNRVLNSMSRLDVVFLDLEMPEMDGYKVLEHLKSDARFQNVPVVAYTVHVSEINVARQLGFHSFLGKPLDADRFPDQLARILRGERVWVVA
jgi:two-component system, cell cycle response regulator DivK